MLNDKIQNKTGNNKDISETARFISGELEYLQRDKDKFDQAKGKDSEGGIKYLNDLQDKRDMLIYANKLLQNAVGQTNIDKEKATKESQSKASKSSDLEKVARGNRPTQVNINIENLVREYKNTFNNVAGALEMTTEQLAKSLISAVNDVSVFQFGS